MAKEKRSFTKWMREMKNSDNDFINAYISNEITLKRGRPSEEGIYNQILKNYGKEMAKNAKSAWKEYVNTDDSTKSNEKEKVAKVNISSSSEMNDIMDFNDDDEYDNENEIINLHHSGNDNDDEEDDDNEVDLHNFDNDNDDTVSNDFYDEIFNKI